MALLSVNNVRIAGISACVPAKVEENKDIPVFVEGEAERVIDQTGIERKHVVSDGMTVSDLCAKAFEAVVNELGWEKESIDVLVLTTAAQDYLVPPTVCIIHGMLGLPESTMTIELRQGCPGWVIGMSTLSSMLSNGNMKRGILLCGDIPTLQNSPLDKETRPLFGDAGTATALEFDENAAPLEFDFGSRGKDFKAIWAQQGGMKEPLTEESLKFVEYGENKLRRPIDVSMDGMSVFSFGFSTAPKSVKSLVEKYNVDLEAIDYLVLHQANHYLNEKIRKKLKVPAEKVPYSMKDYGNTGSPSIPLTIVSQCNEDFRNKPLDIIACAFGVGLAWGSVHFKTDKIVCPPVQLL